MTFTMSDPSRRVHVGTMFNYVKLVRNSAWVGSRQPPHEYGIQHGPSVFQREWSNPSEDFLMTTLIWQLLP